jgi:putative oxidoreductase
LILRIGIAFLLARHGFDKLKDLLAGTTDFPDPLHVGGQLSLALIVFAEFFCSIFLALGLFTRFALMVLMAAMVVIIIIVHAGTPLNDREEALLFLLPYITLFCTGAGRFSLDNRLFKRG